MTKDELLDQLESLSHVERVRAMIALGRRGDAEARAHRRPRARRLLRALPRTV